MMSDELNRFIICQRFFGEAKQVQSFGGGGAKTSLEPLD